MLLCSYSLCSFCKTKPILKWAKRRKILLERKIWQWAGFGAEKNKANSIVHSSLFVVQSKNNRNQFEKTKPIWKFIVRCSWFIAKTNNNIAASIGVNLCQRYPCPKNEVEKTKPIISYCVLLGSPYGLRAAYCVSGFEKTKPILKWTKRRKLLLERMIWQ